jgi:hypothetical protein
MVCDAGGGTVVRLLRYFADANINAITRTLSRTRFDKNDLFVWRKL